MKTPEIREGHMYQMIAGEIVEVVRWDGMLLPITDPITREIPGQQVLRLETGEVNDKKQTLQILRIVDPSIMEMHEEAEDRQET